MNLKPQPKSLDMRRVADRMALWRPVTVRHGRVSSGLGMEFQ